MCGIVYEKLYFSIM